MNNAGLYIHVPFCVKKCGYCDFYSVPYGEAAAYRYTEAAVRNIKAYAGRAIADTVYFGGGTPSLLPVECVRAILSAAREYLNLNAGEVTLEVNPDTVDAEKIAGYDKDIRLSFGLQSASDTELAFLGRTHTFGQARDAVTAAYSAGIKNISCDLIFGLPGQTSESLSRTVRAVTSLPVTHISAYILKVEKNTPFYSAGIQLPDEDATAEMYLSLVSELDRLSFKQYEVSNFCKPGYECRHNLKYWRCEEYIGIGPSAHGFFGGKRYAVPPSAEEFTDSDLQEEAVTETAPGSFEEKAMLALRLVPGLDLNLFPEHKHRVLGNAAPLRDGGFLRTDSNIITLTPKGFLVSNTVIGRLLF
ncbi:MAG: radical SAM family heme chaperone HemW [Oscillospiraceae bacterium]|nr:radical SAM family heme chaperone HemW [Oscillospiraceae bacterium]